MDIEQMDIEQLDIEHLDIEQMIERLLSPVVKKF